MGIDWGDVPTWASAIFALAAFCAALSLFLVEARRDRRQERVDRTAQAQLVTGWVKLRPGYNQLQLTVKNASTACIFDVYAAYEAYGKVFGYETVDVLTPGNELMNPMDVQILKEFAMWQSRQPNEWSQNIRAVLYFRDSGNALWHRDYYGFIREISKDDAGYSAAVRAEQREILKRIGERRPIDVDDEELQENVRIWGTPISED